MEYWRAFDRFAADPSLTDLTETQNVSAGEASNVILDEIQVLRENNHIATGGRTFRNLVVGEPSFGSDPAVVQVTYCNDRSAVKVLDATTMEDTGLRPHPFVTAKATLERGADEKWRVAMIRDQVVESC